MSALVALCACTIQGAVRMPAHFADGMILQTNAEYGARAFINGFADPGEHVTVTYNNLVMHTTADADGNWIIQTHSPDGNITVQGENGPAISAINVRGGDVFFCSGQSNMVFPMSLTLNATAEIATAADYPNFKLFTVPMTTADTEQRDIPVDPVKYPGQSQWLTSSPENIKNFSAVCYMAVREIARQHTNSRPMGLIFSAWGGTRIEAWMSPRALKTCSDRGFVVPRASGQNGASKLWNAMVAPISRVSVRAALWYQGEANADQGLKFANQSYSADYYSCMINSMAADWRDRKGMGDFTFAAVSLPPSHAPSSDDTKATGRQAVRDGTARLEPHAGGETDISAVAVTIDLGGSSAWGYDHPPNKNEIARRLGLATMHAAYALQWDDLHYEGPRLLHISSTDGGDLAVLEFARRGANATAPTLSLADVPDCTTCCAKSNNTFEYSPDNGNTWAAIQPSQIAIGTGPAAGALTISGLYDVTHVRYAWRDFVNCVVVNADGLPLAPFSRAITKPKTNSVTEARIRTGKLTHPPMGFNSWNFYHCNIDEQTLHALADAMVSNGMRDAGYEYINVDDCWQVERDSNGTILADPARFPSGIKATADYIHSVGLKFGLYTARGSRTCQNRPGSYQHELQDAATYCDWGLDYLKNDNCGGENWPADNTSWIKFGQGFDECFKKTGRYTVRSIEYCRQPDASQCGGWIAGVANLWRTTGDVQATWESIMSNLHSQNNMAPVARTGHYNDPDMLQIGNVGVSLIEQQSMFSMWCVVGAPLLAGTDLVHASAETLRILTNKEAIAINQDAGKGGDAPQGTLLAQDALGNEVWAKPLFNGDIAVALLNLGATNATISASWQQLGLPEGTAFTVRDTWKHADLGHAKGNVTAVVASHGVALLRLSAQNS